MAIGWRGQYIRYREFFLNIVAVYKKRPDLRAFLEVALSLSTIIIFGIFAIKPTALTIISLSNEIKDKKATITTLDTKIANLSRAQTLLNQNQSSLSDIDTAVPSSPQLGVITEQVQGLSSKDSVDTVGVSIGQITLSGTDNIKPSKEFDPLPAPAKQMTVSISVKGSYSNLISFTKDLENLKVPVQIDNITISSSQSESGKIIVEVITARVPFLGE